MSWQKETRQFAFSRLPFLFIVQSLVCGPKVSMARIGGERSGIGRLRFEVLILVVKFCI